MKKLLGFLQSNMAVLLAAIASLSTQLWHSVRAFVHLDVGGSDNYWNYLFGIMFSLSTSFAILVFTVRGRKNLAYFFLVVEVFINVIHYGVIGMDLGPIMISTVFMCLIVPITISVYSSEIDVNEMEEAKPIHPPGAIDKKLSDEDFIESVNSIVGFDITNSKDKSGDIDPSTRGELRALWKQRKDMNATELLSKIDSILKSKPEDRPLFKNL